MEEETNPSQATDESGEARLNLAAIWKLTDWLPSIIMVISSILGLLLVAPLFGQGIPMNIDLPFHYGRVLCYENSEMWSLPTAWCGHGQAGIATFQGYALVPFHVVAALSWFFDTLTAFKIMLVLVLFSLPLGAYYLLRTLGKPLAGAFAFAFLLLEHGGWHSGGFEKIFFVGLFSNALGSAMMLFSIAFAIQFFKEPTMKRLVTTTLVTSVFFLSHAATFMFFPIPLFILTYLYWDNAAKNWKMFVAYPLLVFLIVGYWFVPFLYKMGYYISSGGGTVKSAEISQYLWNGIHKWIAYLGIIGLLFMLLNKKKEYQSIGMIAASIPTLWVIGFVWESFPYFSLVQMIRNLADFRSLLAIGAAVILAYFAQMKIKISKNAHPWMLIPALLVVGMIMSQTYTVTSSSSKNIMLSSMGNIPTLEPLYKSVGSATGRIMVEDTLFDFGNTPLTLSHPWSTSPAYSNKEFIGAGDNLYNKNDFSNTQVGILLNSSINDWSDGALLEYLDELNIEYVIAYNPTYTARFNRLPGIRVYKNDTPPWIIYKTPLSPSWFKSPDANFDAITYKTTWASATYESPNPTSIRFKVREWPNWKATIDGAALKLRQGKMGLIEADAPAGKHTIDFTYKMIWVDWFGYLLSIAGIALLAWAWRLPSD
ncbi:MAG: hypothetical protein AABX47_08885 [Nanoarchaeota archaeon]